MRSGSAVRAELAALDAGGDRLGEPVAHARVQARRGRAHLGVAHGAQPQLDPEDPVALEEPGVGQELVDHRGEALDASESASPSPGPRRTSPASS